MACRRERVRGMYIIVAEAVLSGTEPAELEKNQVDGQVHCTGRGRG